MKKLGYISMLAATVLLSACNNFEPFDYTEVENGGYIEPAGSGTLADPYNVSKALEVQDNSTAWVKGYIVGQVAGADIAYDSQFDAPFTGAVYDDGVSTVGTNVLLAAKSDEMNHSACLVVQLPKGDVRTALELLAHPENDGKEVELYGKLTKYFGVSGLKETQAAIFNGDTLGTMPAVDTPDTPEEGVLFSETFTSSLGQFTIDDKNLPAGLSFVWSYSSNYQCAKASAYYQKDYVAESWLVSPAIELNNKPATLIFDHAANYIKNDKNKDMRVLYTTDNGANWVEAVIPTYPAGGDFTFVSSGEIGLPAAASIKFAFVYTSTTKGACTWELKNVKVLDKEAEIVTPENPDTPVTPPADGEGEGSRENPFNVTSAVAQNNSGAKVWVKAFIVGQINGKSMSDAEFDAPFNIPDGSTQGTNVLIADAAATTSTDACMPVQLPSGAVRNGINLPDNPTMDGKEVLLYGELVEYFKAKGLKNVTCAIVDGVVYGKEPVVVDDDVILNVPFTSGLGGFEAFSIVGDQAWQSDPTYGANMSGFASGSSHANEDWLVSPALNLAGKSNVVLTFDHAINKGDLANLKTNHTLWITDNYAGGDPNSTTWQQVEITTYPDGASWTFVSSGEIVIPAEYLKDNVRIAFKYLCSDSESATWEIRDLIMQ